MDIKEKIIRSATEQFMSYGVKSITMDEIAINLGMSKRTIYENFANKKELLIACVEYMHATQEHEEEEIAEKAETILDEFFELFYKADERYERQGKFAYEITKFYPDIFENRYREYNERAIEKLKKRMQKGIDQGVILPNLNLEFSTYMMLEMVYNVFSRRRRIVQMHIPLTDAFRYIIVYLLRGFSTDKGIRIIDEKIKNWKYVL